MGGKGVTTHREGPQASPQPQNKTKREGRKKGKENKRETMKRREIMLKYVPNINPRSVSNSASPSLAKV